MSKIRYLIEVYKKNNTSGVPGDFTYDTTPSISMNDSLSMDSDKSIEASTDSFSTKIQNMKDAYGNYVYRDNIKVDDRIVIYITVKEDITSINKSSYRRFDGIISERIVETNADNKFIDLKGNSRLDRFLNFTYPATFEPTASFDSYASDIIQALITAVIDDNKNYTITWDSGNDTTTTPIQYFKNYRPVIEMIEELSKQSINGEFNAYFYLDSDNHLIWKQKSKDTDTLKLIEGVDFKKIKVNTKVWEVMNAMIVDCGVDPSGRSIHAMYYDETSAGEYGLKWANTIEPQTEIASSLISKQQGLAGWTNNSDENKQDFPDSSSYPLTLTFESRNSNGIMSGTKVIVSSDSEWVQSIRTEAKWQGIDWVKQVLDLTGHVRPKVDIEMVGGDWELGSGRTGTNVENCLSSLSYPIMQGDFVEIVSESEGGDFYVSSTQGKKMRCIAVSHDLGINGWNTSLRFELDVDDAANYRPTGHI